MFSPGVAAGCLATDGEVEDYPITILEPGIGVTEQASAPVYNAGTGNYDLT